jgi:hypothetical protein
VRGVFGKELEVTETSEKKVKKYLSPIAGQPGLSRQFCVSD